MEVRRTARDVCGRNAKKWDRSISALPRPAGQHRINQTPISKGGWAGGKRPVNRRLRKTKNTAKHRDRARESAGQGRTEGTGSSHKFGLAPTPRQTTVCGRNAKKWDRGKQSGATCDLGPFRIQQGRGCQAIFSWGQTVHHTLSACTAKEIGLQNTKLHCLKFTGVWDVDKGITNLLHCGKVLLLCVALCGWLCVTEPAFASYHLCVRTPGSWAGITPAAAWDCPMHVPPRNFTVTSNSFPIRCF